MGPSVYKADNHQKIMKKGGQPESGPGNRVPIVPAFSMVENAAFTYLQQELPEGKSTVGTKVDVSHVSPSPVGMEITVTVEVTDISANGKMVDFKATATDTAGLIGEGTHQRAVITVDRFMDKCQAKLG